MSLLRSTDRRLPVFNNWLDSFFSDSDQFFGNWDSQRSIPPVNVEETEESFKMELAAPGKKKEDFKVEIDNGILVISSEQDSSEESSEKNYKRKEYSYQSFSRSFTLPENVNEDAIEAQYSKGVLQLTIPKTEASKPLRKEIEIS